MEVKPALSTLLYTVLTRLQLEYHVQFWPPQLKTSVKKQESVHQKANKLFGSLQHYGLQEMQRPVSA